MARLGARAGDAGWGCQAQGAGAVSVPWLWGPMTWLRSSDRLTLGQPSAGQLGQTLVVMLVMCCCPLELSGRRPQTPKQPRAHSAPRQPRAIRPARKPALWAGTPFQAHVGTRRPYPAPAARTRPKWRVCALDRTTPALPHGNRGPSDPFASPPSGRAHRFEPAWGSPAAPVPVPAARARPRVACVLDSIV